MAHATLRSRFICVAPVIAFLVVSAACPRPIDPPPPERDDTVGSECRQDDACPLRVPCINGRCFSAGASCTIESHCGEHYTCVDGVCTSDPLACGGDVPECCSDVECASGQACEGFTCVLAPCDVSTDCLILFGVSDQRCERSGDCSDNGSCVAFTPPQCVTVEGTCCDNGDESGGCRAQLMLGVDGAAVGCTMSGSCIDGHCEWPSEPPEGGRLF